MKILDDAQIKQKIVRLSYEILEQHFDKPDLIIAGMNKRGEQLAALIREQLRSISELPIKKAHIQLDPANPSIDNLTFEFDGELKNKSIIVIDDVANTGRTLFYACQPFLGHKPASLEAAVLVDRKHKSFPIKVDFVGLSLATTLKENIRVEFSDDGNAAYLD
jgi:pyrimidine operon attenuation protein/uracil phosphoribosyltransferase